MYTGDPRGYRLEILALLGALTCLQACQELKPESDRAANDRSGGNVTQGSTSPAPSAGTTATASEETPSGICTNCGSGGTTLLELTLRGTGGSAAGNTNSGGTLATATTVTSAPRSAQETGGVGYGGATNTETRLGNGGGFGGVSVGSGGATLTAHEAGGAGYGGATNTETRLGGGGGFGGDSVGSGGATLTADEAGGTGYGGAMTTESRLGSSGELGGVTFASGGAGNLGTTGGGIVGGAGTFSAGGGSSVTTGTEHFMPDAFIDDWPESTAGDLWSLAPTAVPWADYIDVCFQAAGSGKTPAFTQAQQDAIRRAVTDSWGRAANVRFNNFGPCLPAPAARSGVEIRVDGKMPPNILGTTDRLGAPDAAGAYTTVSFATAEPSDRTVIHVFGHVLGFLHPAFDDSCPPEVDAGSAGDAVPFAQSIMSQRPCRAAAQLTPNDIVAVQNTYSRRTPGSLVGMNAQCLDVFIPVEEDRATAQVYECHGGSNQQWRMFPDGTFLSPEYSEFYLDVYNGNLEDGTLVALYGPNSVLSANQTWAFEKVEIRGIGGLCVASPGLSRSAASPLQLKACSNQPSEDWNVEWLSTSTIQIRSASAGMWCIQAPEQVGGALILAPCNSSPSQAFGITALGELTYQGLCWSSPGAEIRQGQLIKLEECVPAGPSKLHQLYHLHGPLKNGLGKCLTTRTFDFRTHDCTYVYACAETSDFTWDYYFYPP